LRHKDVPHKTRIGAGPVPVKDHYRQLGDAKNIVSGRRMNRKNAASTGVLRRVCQERWNFFISDEQSE
jgi:hypothetical protein